jgi:uncharacterized protein YggE
VIAIAAKSGASVVGAIESSALDEQDARCQALKQATSRARTYAEGMAAELGLRTVRVVSAESSPTPLPAWPPMAGPRMPAKKKAAVATPMEAGTIEIRAQVTLTLEVAP